MSRPLLDNRGGDADDGDLIEPDHLGATFWPAIDLSTATVLLRRIMPDGTRSTIWRRRGVEGEARDIYEWATDRRDQWHYWGRLVTLFGDQALGAIVVQKSLVAAESQAAKTEMERLEREDRERQHRHVELFILDNRNKRPGLSLESGDETKPFFVMRFSEKWERDRVVDWLRLQDARFIEFRDLMRAEGAMAVERAIMAGMLCTEQEIKATGRSAGGRRPLRFWRGE